jgi:hypothetical protein
MAHTRDESYRGGCLRTCHLRTFQTLEPWRPCQGSQVHFSFIQSIHGQRTVLTRSMHGQYMVNTRSMQGQCTANARSMHSQYTVNARSGQCTVNTWSMHSQYTINTWSTHNQYTVNGRSMRGQYPVKTRSMQKITRSVRGSGSPRQMVKLTPNGEFSIICLFNLTILVH